MKHVRPLIGPVSVSLLNQGVSAATNFLFAVYLVRALGAEAYGLYATAFSLALLLSGIGNATILLQMVVRIFKKAAAHRRAYATAMLWLAIGVSVALIFGVLVLAVPLRGALPGEFASPGLLLSSVAAASTLLGKEFFVRYAYIEKKESVALLVNFSVAVILAMAVGVFAALELQKGAAEFVYIYAVAQACGAIVGIFQSKLSLLEVSTNEIAAAAREAWAGGRWVIVMSAAFWLQTNFYIYVTTRVLGTAAVGYVAASRLLIAPITVLLPAVQQVLLPRLAEIRDRTSVLLVPTALQMTVLLFGLSLCYSVLVMLGGDRLRSVVLGGELGGAPEVGRLVLTWALFAILHVIRTGAAGVLQVQLRFARVSFVYLAAAVVGIVGALVWAGRHGVVGVMWGMILSEMFTASAMWALAAWSDRHGKEQGSAGPANG